MTHSGIPTRTIQILSATWIDLALVCADLSEAEWKQPSDVPGWSVQDLLAHIIGTERLLEGLPLAVPLPDFGDHVRNVMGEFNENEVASRRSMRGADVLAEWNELRARRDETLAGADAGYFAQPMATPTGPGTMADFLDVRILDCWIHEQDIRRALGTPANPGGAAAEHTIDRLVRTIPIVIGKRAACPEGRAVVLRIVGEVKRDLTCEVRDGRAGFVDQPSSPPLCTIEMDTEVFLALATGRQATTAADGRAIINADDEAGRELGRRVISHFNVMI